MKESKVHLVSSALASNNNQSHFATDRYLEFVEEQKLVNEALMNSVSQILQDIRKQAASFSIEKRAHRNNYLYLKNTLLQTAKTSKSVEAHLNRQVSFYKQVLGRSKDQDEALVRLQRSVNRQKMFLNNLVIKQDNYYNSILEKFEENNTINENSLEKQDLHEVFDEQKKLSIKLDNYYENVSNYLKEHNASFEKSLEKQEVLTKQNEIILENLKRQEVHQEKAIYEVKKLLEKFLLIKSGIIKLLSSLPPNYPIKQIVAGGVSIPVESLLLVNNKTGKAFFSNGIKTISIDVEKIEAIHWE